jgi:acetyl-CoA carboxylase biotin carboxylase subunit
LAAEDPDRDFLPSPGRVTEWVIPSGAGLRVDSHVQVGTTIPPYYDSMIAKLLAHGPDRPAALSLLSRALDKVRIAGVANTVALLRQIIVAPDFLAGPVTTGWLEREFRG